ncbi:MAG: hypothetical protein R3Y49_07270 [Rikenellaceae bacterium]
MSRMCHSAAPNKVAALVDKSIASALHVAGASNDKVTSSASLVTVTEV